MPYRPAIAQGQFWQSDIKGGEMRIGICAPSTPFTRQDADRVIAIAAEHHPAVELVFDDQCFIEQGHFAGSDTQRLDAFVARRHQLAQRYDQLLANLPLTTPWQNPDSYSGLHLYVIRLQLDKIGKTHCQVFEGLREQGIGVNLHYIPVHTQPHYQRMGFKVGDYPQAEQYYAEAISLPMFQTLTDEQQDQVVDVLRGVLAV